jgi:hypothetical protein
MARKKHPKPEVEEALRYAEKHGWRVRIGGSHAWGRIYCPYNDKDCRCGEFCIASVWSTPPGMQKTMPGRSDVWSLTAKTTPRNNFPITRETAYERI